VAPLRLNQGDATCRGAVRFIALDRRYLEVLGEKFSISIAKLVDYEQLGQSNLPRLFAILGGGADGSQEPGVVRPGNWWAGGEYWVEAMEEIEISSLPPPPGCDRPID
jgi:hypothetical protein